LRKSLFFPLAALAALALGAAPAVAVTTHTVLYKSTPAEGTVSVPSLGAEAYSFNQIGNEVILRPHHAPIKHVSVTMESWACQTGGWSTGDCSTTPGSTFQAPITLHLYRYSHTNDSTGEVTPGREIMSVTRTFNIRYRPSSESPTESRFMGSDGKLHNGIAQTVSFPVHRALGNDVVWTVSYDTNTSGLEPLGHTGPMDSLNVGLAPATSVGHDRFPGSIFWDTRQAGFANGAPFVTGELNRDSGWTGYVPAAKFSTR